MFSGEFSKYQLASENVSNHRNILEYPHWVQIRIMMETLGKTTTSAFWCFSFSALDFDCVSPKEIYLNSQIHVSPVIVYTRCKIAPLMWFWETRPVWVITEGNAGWCLFNFSSANNTSQLKMFVLSYDMILYFYIYICGMYYFTPKSEYLSLKHEECFQKGDSIYDRMNKSWLSLYRMYRL